MDSEVGLVVLVATSLAFDTTFFSILSVNPALAGLLLVLLAPDLAVGEFSFFATELRAFAVVLPVTSLCGSLSATSADLEIAVFLARDFTTGFGPGLATLETLLVAAAAGGADFRGALAESFGVFSVIFALAIVLPGEAAACPGFRALLGDVDLLSETGAFFAAVFLTVRFMVLSLKSAVKHYYDWPAIQ